MKPVDAFNIDFDYALSDNITLSLTADVQLHHSDPHYLITNFHFKKNPDSHPLLPDISIMALEEKNSVNWVHSDSFRETILSTAIGKAIEAKGDFQVANKSQ